MPGLDGLQLHRTLIVELGMDGWLVADFRRGNPMFVQLTGLESGILTRRAFLWLPAPGKGEPLVIGSRVDGHTFAELDLPVHLYTGLADMEVLLRETLPAGGTVAMEWVERGALPTISRVDGGLIDLIRGQGVAVVSSGDIIAALEVWSEEQRALHEAAGRVVDEARRAALDRCRDMLRSGRRVTEGDLAAYIVEYFTAHGIEAGDGPDVAIGGNAADPHYATGGGEGAEIVRDDVLLIDLWGRSPQADNAPYADSTWMAFTGSEPPGEVLRVFEVVRDARDVALRLLEGAVGGAAPLRGFEVDRVAREFIAEAGMEDHLIHRTGHSLGITHVHGMGTNFDDVEFPDPRPVLPFTGFTVEPGLYFPDRFGMRLEVSAMLLRDELRITTERQSELTVMDLS